LGGAPSKQLINKNNTASSAIETMIQMYGHIFRGRTVKTKPNKCWPQPLGCYDNSIVPRTFLKTN